MDVMPLSARPGDMNTESSLGGGNGSKKKRGRPRKYDSTGSRMSDPFWRTMSSPSNLFPESGTEPISNSGMWPADSATRILNAHVIIIDRGEDVEKKISSFSEASPWNFCILSATGPLAMATIYQPMSATRLSYEGCFEILKLSGSFTCVESNGTLERTGRMTVSMANSDGQLIGGLVGGPLIAASPLQVVLGTFEEKGQAAPRMKSPPEPSITEVPIASGKTWQQL